MTLGEIIKSYRESHDMSMDAFSAISGISKSYISLLEKNKHPRTGDPIAPSLQIIKQAGDAMNADFDELIAAIDSDVTVMPVPTKRNCALIPIVGRVAAGFPMLMVEEIEGYEEIPERMSRSGNFIAMRIHGQSMEPRMCEGDIIIVKEQDDADDGQIVVACVNGDDATCKRLRKRSGQICLMSNNPAYPPQWYTPNEVAIRGVVVEMRAKF